jgi:hypothetical protein
MKKTIFYISIIISLILLVNIVSIVKNDLDRLTEYGYGYLVGKIILFVLFFTFILLTKKSVIKKEKLE